MLAEVLADDRPDGIEVRLPRCHLYVTEGFEWVATYRAKHDAS